MKIRLLSDLHVEGNKFYYEYAGEDLVVLAGDIHTQGRHEFILDQIPSNVKILFVPGNHEYYGAVFEWANSNFRKLEDKYPNFKFLYNESITIDNIEFFGGTMFTDLNLYGDPTKAGLMAQRGIADFSWISRENPIPPDFDMSYLHQLERRWTTDDHIAEFNLFCSNLESWIKQPRDRKRVVISHFVPHPDVSDPRYGGSPLNPYFIAHMRHYFADVDAWLFGHTHSSCDKIIENCRFVCNPRGYGNENAGGFINNLIVEI